MLILLYQSYFKGSQYEDKYGYELLNDINGDFDAGVRLSF